MNRHADNLRPGKNGLQGAKGMKVRLNPMQKDFCREYVKCGFGGEAARIAGYKDTKGAPGKLLKNPAILAYIDSLQVRAESEAVFTRQQVLETLTAEAKSAASDMARIRALELLGKHHKLFIERVEHGGVGEFDHMSDDELKADIVKLLSEDGVTVN